MNRNRNLLHSNSTNRATSRPLESVQELASCSYAPSEGSCFKENVDVNKSGTQKLNLEPLQMKRKKKGGGCNLRKSLAWDRAFFTEEGVLDPRELSIITGASCGEASPGINGTPSNSKRTLKATDCQSSQKIKAGFGSKSGSNCGGCPRPLSSSSIKRAGNLNAAKAAVKESKLQKVPISKTGPTPIQTSKRKIPRPISLNSGQIDQPASIRTNRASGTSSTTLRTTLTTPKVGTLQPVSHSEANSRNSRLKEHTSTNPSQILAVKADKDSDSKMITLNTAPSSPVHSFGDTGESISASTSFTRHAHDSDLNTHSSQNQTMKPSGLRMPSPSLSFFGKPKAPTSHDLSARNADSSIFESLKPGSLRLQDNLRTPQKDNNILYSSSSISRGVCISSRLECLVPPHVNEASCETVKSNLERNSMPLMEMKVSSDALHSYLIGSESIEDHPFNSQMQDHSKKNGTVISPPEAEVQNIDKQILSEDVSYNREVNASSDGGWRNPKISGNNHGTYGSERESTSDKSSKGPSPSILCTLNDDASSIGTDLGYVHEHRCKNHLEMQETSCEQSYFELRNGDSDQAICSPAVTDNTTRGDDNVLKKELAAEILDGSQQSGTQSSCSKDSNVEFKLECEFLSDEAVCKAADTENLLGCEEYLPKAELASPADGFRDNLDAMSDVADDTNLVRTRSEGKAVCHEVNSGLEKDEGTSTRDRLSVVATEERWQAENDQKNHEPEATFLHDLAARRLSNSLCQATPKVENEDCSLFPSTRSCEVPPRKYLRILNDVVLQAEDYGEYTCKTSIMASEENETNMNQIGTASNTLLVQPPSTNEHFNQTESSKLLNSDFTAENLSLSKDGWNLQNLFLTKSTASEESSDENIFKRVVDSFERGENASRKSSVCLPESPFRHENCIATNAKGESNQEMESDSLCIEISEDSSDPVNDQPNSNDLQPNSNDLQPEGVLAPTSNNRLDGSNTQGRKLILPQNAVPFSDEWLAAIEAAGEDILTKKGGAVQNSPTEKSLPEPSPWSPVKKKNNQIGPFDCTKCTNILPSDSN